MQTQTSLCSGSGFTLQIDNDQPLQSLGVNNGVTGTAFIWLNRHVISPGSFPLGISALTNVWQATGTGLVGGESVQMVVYIDADGDGNPANATLVASELITVPAPDDALRRVHPFTIPTQINGPGDIYVGFADVQTSIDGAIRFMAAQDSSGAGGASFAVFNNSAATPLNINSLGANDNVISLSSTGVPGAWMVRAQGTCLTCPDTNLGSTLPLTVTGSTTGGSSFFAGSCGGGGAPEKTFRYSAPVAGSYTIDTIGSVFDTVLYVLDGSCSGPPLACNDDTIGLTSQVQITLSAGQTIVIFVDGFGSANGNFTLHITGPSVATPTPSNSPTNTNTPTVTQTATRTLTQIPISTPSASATMTRTLPATNTNTPTVTQTATRTPTQTLTLSPSSTATITRTPAPTNSNTPTATFTRTLAAALTPTNTGTPTSTVTATPTLTPTSTRTRTPTGPSPTPTQTSTVSVDLGRGVGRTGGIACVPASLTARGNAVVSTSNDIGFEATAFSVNACTINPSIGPATASDKQLARSSPGVGVARLAVFGLNVNPIPDGLLYTCEFGIQAGATQGTHQLTNLPGAADASGDLTGVVGRAGEIIVTNCPGDCDGNGIVSIGEVMKCVNLFLGQPLCNLSNPAQSCPAADADGNGTVSIGEVNQCVNRMLNGCP